MYEIIDELLLKSIFPTNIMSSSELFVLQIYELLYAFYNIAFLNTEIGCSDTLLTPSLI